MTAREYLGQLRTKKLAYDFAKDYVLQLKQEFYSLHGMQVEEKVQTSPSNNTLLEFYEKVEEAGERATRYLEVYMEAKMEREDKINRLENTQYIKVLKAKYIKCLPTLNAVAEYLNYSESWTKQLHGQALQEFERTYQKCLEKIP